MEQEQIFLEIAPTTFRVTRDLDQVIPRKNDWSKRCILEISKINRVESYLLRVFLVVSFFLRSTHKTAKFKSETLGCRLRIGFSNQSGFRSVITWKTDANCQINQVQYCTSNEESTPFWK